MSIQAKAKVKGVTGKKNGIEVKLLLKRVPGQYDQLAKLLEEDAEAEVTICAVDSGLFDEKQESEG